MEKFTHLLYGRPTAVETDHKPLEIIWEQNITSAPKRLQRMLLRMQPYDLHLVYTKGVHMYVADTPSRAYLTVAQETSCPDHVLAMTDDAEDQETINVIAVSDDREGGNQKSHQCGPP